MSKYIVVALYKFVHLPNFEQLQAPITKVCKDNGVMGTLLLAEEGINGTIAGSRAGIAAVLGFLKTYPEFVGLEHKESRADEAPFYRMKVRLKQEIVTLGQPDVDPNQKVGEYVDPKDWNALLDDPDVVVLDTRNDYEVGIGAFKNAQNPRTTNFREFPEFVKKQLDPRKHKKIAMYCTGGIRCEKASSYMLAQGFEKVYHLKGGILKYLETIPQAQSYWDGECFVFDQRVAVKHNLEVGSYDQCYGCRHPLSEEDKQSKLYKPGVYCHLCYEHRSEAQHQRAQQRQQQMQLAKKRNQVHLGQMPS
ncbi:MAG: rhodanese-related sulfurtransferase [Pseudomonadota bacterium]